MARQFWKISTIAGVALCGMLAAGVARAQTDTAPPADAAAPAADAAAPEPDAAATKTKMKAKAKHKMAKPAMGKTSVKITNNRAVGLTDLQGGESGSGKSEKIAGPLGPGKSVMVAVKHGKECLFDLSGVYDDGSTMEASGVDLCKDKKLGLVD